MKKKNLLAKPRSKDHVSCLSSLAPSHQEIPECDVIGEAGGWGVYSRILDLPLGSRARDFSKSQSLEGSSEFFQVPGIWGNIKKCEELWRNMKDIWRPMKKYKENNMMKYEGYMKKYEGNIKKYEGIIKDIYEEIWRKIWRKY